MGWLGLEAPCTFAPGTPSPNGRIRLAGLTNIISHFDMCVVHPSDESTGFVEFEVNPISGSIYWRSKPLIARAICCRKYETHWHLYVGLIPWNLLWRKHPARDLYDPFLELTFPSDDCVLLQDIPVSGAHIMHFPRFDAPPFPDGLDPCINKMAELILKSANEVSYLYDVDLVRTELSCQPHSHSAPCVLQSSLFFHYLAFVVPGQTFSYMPTVTLSVYWT